MEGHCNSAGDRTQELAQGRDAKIIIITATAYAGELRAVRASEQPPLCSLSASFGNIYLYISLLPQRSVSRGQKKYLNYVST